MTSSYVLLLASKQTAALDYLRDALCDIASGIYLLVGKIFDLFFKITEYTMFDNDMILDLFNRMFMIIGVFMFFKLCVSFISYLITPEAVKDKEKGAGKLFGRLITMLILLYVLMPQQGFNLWGVQEADEKYQFNGLLFGALYDFQSRVINDGTISKLILGKSVSNSEVEKTNIGEEIAMMIHASFLNIADTDDECKDLAQKNLSSITTISDVVNSTCQDDGAKAGYYQYTYNGFMAIIVGIGVCVIVFLFSFDVAVRMIKLGILRLLSPIPAISYIDPKSSKDGMFANYVKTLTSTYLDLFLRLAIIYLVIYLIDNINKNFENLITSNNDVGIEAAVILISLLFFAAQAPKFIQQALGIKSKGTGLGFGASLIGGALSGMVAGAATGGVWGALKGTVGGASTGASNQWAAQNGHAHQGSATQEARQRGATLGTGEVDPSKSGVFGLVGGRIATAMTGTRDRDIQTTKGAMYAHKNMGEKQKQLLEDMRSSNFDATNMTNDQRSALADAGVRLNDNGQYVITDANGVEQVIGDQDVLDRLQNRAMDHDTKYNKLNSIVSDAQKYRESRVPSAKNPDIGIGKRRVRRQVNDLDSNGNFLGRPEQRLSTYGSQDDEHVNYRR